MLAILAGGSIAMRLALLFERPLWFDELFTVWASRKEPGSLLELLRLDSGPPLFYLLEAPFVRIGDLAARALPFLASLLLFAASPTLPRGRARIAFVALLSSSLLVNLYSVEARAYALLSLLVLAAFLLTVRGAESTGRLAAGAAGAALALYTHYLAFFAVGALLAATLARRRWRAAAALAIALALFAPWVPVLRGQPAAAISWIAEPPLQTVAGFLSALGGVGRVPAPFGPSLPTLLVMFGAAAGVLALVTALAAARGDPEVRSALAVTLLALAGALLLPPDRPVAFAGRSELAILPVWLWGLARAFGSGGQTPFGVRPPGARLLLAAMVPAGILATALVVFAPHPPSALTAAVAELSSVARRGDVAVAGAGFYLPAIVAAEEGRLAASVHPLPASLAAHPGWFVPGPPGPEEAHSIVTAASGVVSGGRLWLLAPPAYGTPAVRQALSRVGRAEELARDRDALLIVCSPTASVRAAPPAQAPPR